jgi:hypothetical protein
VILDAQVAALLVRVTARVSAVLLAGSLLVAARRLAGAVAGAPPTGATRLADVSVFAAFVVSHTIHFGCVTLLALAIDGRNIRDSGGWIPVLAVGALFYVGSFLVLRVKLRAAGFWASASDGRREAIPLVLIWLVFFQAFILRATQWWFFAALSAALLYSVARFLYVTLRSRS